MVTIEQIEKMSYGDGRSLMKPLPSGNFVALVESEGQPAVAQFAWDDEAQKWVPYLIKIVEDIMSGDFGNTWKYWVGGILIYVLGAITDHYVDLATLFGLN